MLDSLVVLKHMVAESRLMFRDPAALTTHRSKLADRHLPWLVQHSAYTALRLREAGLSAAEWRRLPPVAKPEMMHYFDTLNTAGLRLEEVLNVARRAEASRDFTPTLRSRTNGGDVTVGLSSGTSGTQGAFLVSRAERLQWAGTVLRHVLPPPWPAGLLNKQRIALVLRAEGGLYRSVQGRRIQFQFLDLVKPMAELADELSRGDPTVLVGPPSVLRALLQAGATARPQRVIAVAEVLEEDDRLVLERGFGPVVQVYQATEGLLALPCSQGQLHLNEAHVHFDFEAVGAGYVRPVITDLRRRVQPMIRHRLDDLLLLAEGRCACGLASRQVQRIAGRQDDALLLPDGHGGRITVWPDFLRAAMNLVSGLLEYRLEQTDEKVLRIRLDPDTPHQRHQVSKEIRAALLRRGVMVERLSITYSTLPCVSSINAFPNKKRRRVTRSWSSLS